MRKVLRHPGLRLIFAANMISMIGSGMNTSGVTWYVLQTTHSEAALGTLLMLQTIPAMLMLPFSGVVIDREDRRRLVMVLDAARAIVILLVAVLVLRGLARLWEIYLMSILVSAGFWMFWPTMNALIQELTPESEFIQANSLLVAGFQGGWLIAGSMVGFVYNSTGLSGVLFIDVASYVLSFTCYLFVRKGRHTVAVPSAHLDKGQFSRFLGGVAITSTMMDMVPKHFMGRVQNTFYFSATCLQLVLAVTVGTVCHNRSLTWGYVIVGSVYVLGCLASTLRVKEPQPFTTENAETSAAGEPQKLAAD